ncbi:MAG: hypothetical protein J6Q96_01125 [Bacteroidales bacterium]|nr:hypothetical protein [Bacteroidales bacterium]
MFEKIKERIRNNNLYKIAKLKREINHKNNIIKRYEEEREPLFNLSNIHTSEIRSLKLTIKRLEKELKKERETKK